MKLKASTQIILLLVSVLMLLIIGYLLYLMASQETSQPSTPSSVTGIPTPTLTLSPSPISTSTSVLSPTESYPLTSTPSAMEGIKKAFAVKYGKPVSSLSVTLSQNTGTHAKGSISFEGEMGGGWFLSYKSTDGWIIVDDGNGTISCDTIAPYNFPVTLVSECWDEKTDSSVKR